MQPVSGFSFYRVNGTAAGTSTVKASPCVVKGIMIGDAKTGTVTVYDSADGTTATVLSAINNNVSGSQPVFIDLGVQMRAGLTVVKAGTTDLTVIYM